jgi:hypothetical protein
MIKIKEYIGDDIDFAIKVIDKFTKDKRISKTLRMEYARMIIDNDTREHWYKVFVSADGVKKEKVKKQFKNNKIKVFETSGISAISVYSKQSFKDAIKKALKVEKQQYKKHKSELNLKAIEHLNNIIQEG